MAESIVSGVAERLGNLLMQESNLLSGVSDQVELLQTELKLMQSLLKDADARQDESELLRLYIAEVRDLAYDAEDIIATYALKVASRKRCTCILYEGMTVPKVGSQIVNIKAKISVLITSFRDYGIRESIIQGGGSSSSWNEREREQRQTFSHLERHSIVGFDDDVNELVEFLLKEGEGNIRVASICGMGGLGKTTLAKMVYNHHEVKQHYDCFAWVYISQQCQRRLVWEGILFSLLSLSKEQRNGIRQLTDAELADKLVQVQKEQKCLVVLDDIWNVEDWNNLCGGFPGNDSKSQILLTSRNKQVPLHIDPESLLYELQCLNDEKSWELFEKIAWREDSKAKTRMKDLGKQMIGYCGGLPLLIIVLGGLLATKQTQEKWEDVLRHVKSYLYVEQNLRINMILALSYNDLPCHLKPCFLYLAHFPEDFEIPTKELIRMWMGEGFISQIQHGGRREGTIMEEGVGERYIWELVQRFMIQVGKRGSLGRIKTRQIHDLMRDFCLLKVQEENFLHITNVFSLKQREGLICKVRRLSIIPESGDNSLKVMTFNKYPYLRSILHLLPPYDQPYFKDFRFKKFKLVRVIHLENFEKHSRKLIRDIGCLIHLRYLSLKDSNINKVSSSIGNLRYLETLDLRILNHSRVPNVFKYMKQLKHLYLPNDYNVHGKLELGNLCYLRTLVNVQPNTIQIPTSFQLNRLWVLKVRTNTRAQDTIQILVSLISRCPNVEKLNILNSIKKKLPEAHQFSQNLAKLTLFKTRLEEDQMATLEKLPNLKILNLLYEAFEGKNMVCSERGFPLLQSLFLSELFQLEEWRVEEGALPNLCHLEIVCCPRLKMIPDGLRFVTTLQKLEIKSMQKSFKDKLDKGGPDFDKVKHVSSIAFQNCGRE
ncbi:putative disease resistance protein At1g50180 [Castanea sativa]|uniref:putative disease resistance protein At1g50180 n=1 Tax=Castanea sativa TaxID=21020 RepID=UPI003F64D0DB